MMYGFQMFYTVWREKKISIFFWFVWILAFSLAAAAKAAEITADDLGFTNGRIAEFAKVFFGTKGAVYEVYPMRAI